MPDTSFFVYALKDPRFTPARPFYIGKGTGIRPYDHLASPGDGAKGSRVREIQASGHEVLVARLVDSLSELQALRIEAELIAAFGTESSGGFLTNSIIPTGRGARPRKGLVLPLGVVEKAQLGLALLKDAVLELAKANKVGISNADVASALGLRSDYGGGSKDYLSYSLLGLLMREGKLARERGSKRHLASVK